MTAVMISIRPKWVEKIASGEKTVEVRKSVPKCGTPFKVYMYCTQDREYSLLQGANLPMHSKSRDYNNIQIHACNQWWAKDHRDRINGKVVGEFVCDKITPFEVQYPAYWYMMNKAILEQACLTKEELHDYIGAGNLAQGWHISDLKIYDKPKELSEFATLKKCNSCKVSGYATSACQYDEKCIVPSIITRPPRSWCYVEELK